MWVPERTESIEEELALEETVRYSLADMTVAPAPVGHVVANSRFGNLYGPESKIIEADRYTVLCMLVF